jgi:zinc protease
LIDAPETADPIGMEGLARLTADLLQRSDTAKRSRRELEAAFARLEASVRVDADRNRTRVRAVAPGRSAGELVGLLAELVLQPDFATVFDAERERAALSAGRAADNAAFQVRALFDRALYGDQHPYGRRATPESVRAISLDHGLAFHADRYRPDRIVFAVSGRVQKEQVSAALDAALTAARPALPRPAPARAIIPPPQAPSQRLIVTREIDTRQGHVLLGHLGIQGLPADHAALELMHHILAGGGFVSRMMELLRTETGITAALYGEVEPGRDTVNPYLWRFSGRPETLARGIWLAIEQIELMREKGLTAEEFENARTAYLDGLIPASYETSHRTAERLAHKHLFGLYEYQSPQYLNYYAGDRAHIEALRRVTLEDVNRAARTYLHPDRLVIAVAGPLDEIRQGATESELPLVAPGRP